jgi:phage terminase small subunit
VGRKPNSSTSKTMKEMRKLKIKPEKHIDGFRAVVTPDPVPDEESIDVDAEESDMDILGDTSLDEDVAYEEAREELDPQRHLHVKYPSPKVNVIFRKMWREFLPSLVNRSNFSPMHLTNLEILCDLYVEHARLSKYIRQHGYTYVAFGRQGKQRKTNPEVQELRRVLSEIRSYSKMLGLVPDKDTGGNKNNNDWE